jgi:hypothetical protein
MSTSDFSAGPVGVFTFPGSGAWQFASWSSKMTFGSPTVAASGVYVLDMNQAAWSSTNGMTWNSLGGVLER